MALRVTIENGTCVLKPAIDMERAALALWIERLAPGDKIAYRGRGPDDGEFWTVRLEAADVGLTLVGNFEADKLVVQQLRNTFYFGCHPIFVEAVGAGVRIAATRCNVCQSYVIDMPSAEWKTCQACSEKCQHELEHGFTHSETKELDVGNFCVKCGRVPAGAAA